MEEVSNTGKKTNWLKRLGLMGFLFFLIKGILWLVLFAGIYFGLMNESTVEKLKDLLPF